MEFVEGCPATSKGSRLGHALRILQGLCTKIAQGRCFLPHFLQGFQPNPIFSLDLLLREIPQRFLKDSSRITGVMAHSNDKATNKASVQLAVRALGTTSRAGIRSCEMSRGKALGYPVSGTMAVRTERSTTPIEGGG